MNSDAAFIKGDSHLICEDYATNYTSQNNLQVVLCDGCSSSQMTDVGARILALTSASYLPVDHPDNPEALLDRITGHLRYLLADHAFQSLPATVFDATLLMAKVVGNAVEIITVGDGVIAIKGKSGNLSILNLEYDKGYPRYLSYRLDAKRKELFLEKQSFLKINKYGTYLFKDEDLEDNCVFSCVHSTDLEDFTMSYVIEDIEWIALMSDGVHSFSCKKELISMFKVVRELLKFKTFTGQFVQRRLNRFKKDCRKWGWEHYDDVSLAVLYLGGS